MRAASSDSWCIRTGHFIALGLLAVLLSTGCSGGDDNPAVTEGGENLPAPEAQEEPVYFPPLAETLAEAATQPSPVEQQVPVEEPVRLTGQLQRQVTLPPLPDSAVETQIHQLLHIVSTAQEKDDFGPARQFLEQALTVSRQHWPADHWRVKDIELSLQYHDHFAAMSPQDRATIREASRLHVLAYQRAAQNNYEEALEQLGRAQALRIPILGEQYMTCVRARGDLMQWKIRAGQYQEVQTQVGQVLEESIRFYGEIHPETALLLWSMGDMQVGLGDPVEADKYFQRALYVFRTAPSGPDDYPQFLTRLSVVYQRQDRLVEAEQCLLEAAEVRRQLEGETSREYVGNLMMLGTMYLNTNNHRLADAALMQAATRAEGQAELAALRSTVLVYLSRSATEQGDIARAEKLVADALALRAASSGQSNAMYAGVLFLQSDIHMRRRQYAEAQAVLREAALIYGQLGPQALASHAACVHRLVHTHLVSGELEEARDLCNELARTHHNSLDQDHPYLASDRAVEARVYLAEGDAATAESLCLQAVAGLEGDPNQAIRHSQCQHALGDVLAAQGRHAEAAQHLQAALEIQRSRLRVGDLATLMTTESYASVLHQLGRSQEAAGFEAQAAAFRGGLAAGNSGQRR